ncbi:MAG: TIGR03364 family FAD-dependent oxidoreductase [Bacteroidota bacterium]
MNLKKKNKPLWEEEYDVIVIGGGIMGISHAYHALNNGLSVALFEKNPSPRDASVRNFGQVVPSGFNTKWQAYGRESLNIYNELQSEVDITIRQEGTVYLASDDEELTLLHELSEINRINGYESELLSQKKCLRKYPGLLKSYVKEGLYFPGELVIDPLVGVARLIDYLRESKAMAYYPNSVVSSVQRGNGGVTVESWTNGGIHTFRGQKVYLCSGNEFEILFPEVFSASGLSIVQLQMMDTKPQNGLRIPGSVLTGWTIRRYEAFQECPSYERIKKNENKGDYHLNNGVHILFKQLLDGSVVIGDSHRYQDVSDGTRMDFNTDNELNCFMLSEAQKIYSLDCWEIRNTWLGHYCQSNQSDLFNLALDNDIHIVTGIGGKGMTGAMGYAKENITKTLNLNSVKYG